MNQIANVNQAMSEIIAHQPEGSTYDEILRELAFARMVKRGLADSDAGRTMSDSAMQAKIQSWQS